MVKNKKERFPGKNKEIRQKKKISLSPFVQDLVALSAFIILLSVLFSPMVFKGYIYPGGDVLESISKPHKINEYYETTGKIALWNPYPLSGIPNVFYLPSPAFTPDYYLEKISDIVSIPLLFFLVGAAGIYFLLKYLKFSVLISFAGSLSFILVPYFSTLVYVGHNTKLEAVMYIPWIVLTFLVFLDKKKLIQLVLFSLLLSLQFRTMHFQVNFYTGLLLLFIGVPYLWTDIKKKNYSSFTRKIFLLMVAFLFSIGMAAYPLFIAKKLSQYSLRADWGVDLQQKKSAVQNAGVDLEEIRSWSLLPGELLDLLIPAASGGTSGEEYQEKRFPELQNKKLPLYWGNLKFSQGYIYAGIITAFLVFFAFLNHKNKLVLSLSLLGFLLLLWSLGMYVRPFYLFCYDYLPFFRNFRSPTTALSVVYFICAILSAYGLNSVNDMKNRKASMVKTTYFIYFSLFLAAGLIFYFIGHSLSYIKPGQDFDPLIVSKLQSIRKEFYFSDVLRYFIFFLLFSGVLVCYFYKIFKFNVLLLLVLVLIAIDLISIRLRFNEKPLSKKEIERSYFNRTSMTGFFESDKENYRIFPNVPNGQLLTYFSQTIGDYDLQMNPAIKDIYRNNLFPDSANRYLVNWNVLKLLNVKYLVLRNRINHPKVDIMHFDADRNEYVYLYKDYLPTGYFVKEYKVIQDDFARLETINKYTFDPAKTALLEIKPAEETVEPDSCFSKMTGFFPDHLQFDVYSDKQALFVISVVYLPDEWKIFIDERQVKEIYKTNHAFQSVVIPPGKHKVQAMFIPGIYKSSWLVSFIASVILYTFILLLLVIQIRHRWKLRSK